MDALQMLLEINKMDKQLTAQNAQIDKIDWSKMKFSHFTQAQFIKYLKKCSEQGQLFGGNFLLAKELQAFADGLDQIVVEYKTYAAFANDSDIESKQLFKDAGGPAVKELFVSPHRFDRLV